MKKFSTYSVIPTEIMLNNDLSSTSKILYGLISSLCNEKGYCWASNDYLGELLGITGTRISLIIKELLEKDLIKSKVEENYKRKITLVGVLTKVKGGIKEKLKGGLTKVKDNNIIEYNKDNILTCKPSVCDNSKELLNLFYRELNPNIKFNNKTLRGDASWLVDKYGMDKLEPMVAYIKANQGDKYFPSITNPSQLREKMAQVVNHYKKNNQGNRIIKI